MIEKILQQNLYLKLNDGKQVIGRVYLKSSLDLKKGEIFNLEEDMWSNAHPQSQTPVMKGRYKVINVSKALAQSVLATNKEDYFTVSYDCERIGNLD